MLPSKRDPVTIPSKMSLPKSAGPFAAELFRNLQAEIVSLWMVVRLKTELLKPENAMPLTVRLVTYVPVAKPPLKSPNGNNVVLSAPAPTNVTS